MTADPDEEEPPALTSADAFALLGNETRIGILQVLWEAYEPRSADNAVPFSDLYDRVGIGDTGNFNYHLGKLTGHFVRSTEDGYVLTNVGFYVVRAVIAGTVGERPTVGPVEVDADCPRCGARVEIGYEDHVLKARCTDCPGIWKRDGSGGLLFRFGLPPAGFADRTPDEAFQATVTYTFHRIASFRSGVCPHCSGVVDTSIDVCESHARTENGVCPQCDRHHVSQILDVCTRCKASVRGPVTIAILDHPVVTAFYQEHDIAHWFASWDAFQRGQTLGEELVGTDPLRVRVTIPCEGDQLRLTLDETLSVVDIER